MNLIIDHWYIDGYVQEWSSYKYIGTQNTAFCMLHYRTDFLSDQNSFYIWTDTRSNYINMYCNCNQFKKMHDVLVVQLFL